MKSILGLVQGAPCRIDVEFKDERGIPHRQKAVVKGKGTNETEELPLYTNHDSIFGEVCAVLGVGWCGGRPARSCGDARVLAAAAAAATSKQRQARAHMRSSSPPLTPNANNQHTTTNNQKGARDAADDQARRAQRHQGAAAGADRARQRARHLPRLCLAR